MMDNNAKFEIGEVVRQIRFSKRITQKQLAKKIKVSQATVAHVESGRKEPSIKTLSKMLQALGLNVLFYTEDGEAFNLGTLSEK